MSPLEMRIALHYYSFPTDFRDGDFSAPGVDKAIKKFLSLGLIAENKSVVRPVDHRKYKGTERLTVYVKQLERVPLPIQRWVYPEALFPVPGVEEP